MQTTTHCPSDIFRYSFPTYNIRKTVLLRFSFYVILTFTSLLPLSGFEQSPFKLTPEFVDVMGGTSSELWKEFNHLLLVGMMSARKHMDRIINFVEIMRSSKL